MKTTPISRQKLLIIEAQKRREEARKKLPNTSDILQKKLDRESKRIINN